MKISEILKYLETLAPLPLQEEYDNSGLIYGDPEWECGRVLLCLDLNMAVLNEAVDKGCNLIIAHHPFIFRPLKKFSPESSQTAILTLAIKSGIALYAIHTNLDNIRKGLNAMLFHKLGIRDYKVLSPKAGQLRKLVTFCPGEHAEMVRKALFEAGAGQIGNYRSCSFNLAGEGTFMAVGEANPFVGELDKLHYEPEIRIEVIYHVRNEAGIVRNLLASHPYEEVAYDLCPLENKDPETGAGLVGLLPEPLSVEVFLQRLKELFRIPVLRHTAGSDQLIRKVAFCSGSGSFLIREAARSGANAFLTADLKYHDFFDASPELLLVDVGHYESEQDVKEWLHAALIEKFPNFAVLISEVNTNPIHYF